MIKGSNEKTYRQYMIKLDNLMFRNKTVKKIVEEQLPLDFEIKISSTRECNIEDDKIVNVGQPEVSLCIDENQLPKTLLEKSFFVFRL